MIKSISRTKVLVVLLIAATGVLGYRYAAPHMHTLSSQASDIRAEAAKLNQRAANGQKVRASPDTYAADLAQYSAAIPDSAAMTDVLDELQATAHAAGVTWLSGTPSKASTDPADAGQARWLIAMTLNGSPAGLNAFLDGLRDTKRLVVVNDVNLAGDGNQMTANVTVRVYATGTDGGQ